LKIISETDLKRAEKRIKIERIEIQPELGRTHRLLLGRPTRLSWPGEQEEKNKMSLACQRARHVRPA
jgi:hypothetical protein